MPPVSCIAVDGARAPACFVAHGGQSAIAAMECVGAIDQVRPAEALDVHPRIAARDVLLRACVPTAAWALSLAPLG